MDIQEVILSDAERAKLAEVKANNTLAFIQVHRQPALKSIFLQNEDALKTSAYWYQKEDDTGNMEWELTDDGLHFLEEYLYHFYIPGYFTAPCDTKYSWEILVFASKEAIVQYCIAHNTIPTQIRGPDGNIVKLNISVEE